jgi:hypothetical protein
MLLSPHGADAAPPYTEITGGGDLDQSVRPALADDGTVVAAEAERLHVGDGTTLSFIDLSADGLVIQDFSDSARAVQVRSEGDVVFVADRPDALGCLGFGGVRGAYRTDTVGTAVTTLLEGCIADEGTEGKVGSDIAMSPNGTVAFSKIVSMNGAIYRGPATGPVTVLRSGSGTFFNTREIGVNDSGRVAVEMEYGDPFGGLQRGILVFDTPEQDLSNIDTAVEKLSVSQRPRLGVNASGTVAFSNDSDFTMMIGNEVFSFDAGVYVADPTLFNTPKMLTKIADKSGDYCGFGRVDINDAGTVVFEAQLVDDLAGCSTGFGAPMDGIFMGADAVRHRIAIRGDSGLEDHEFFDSILLGEINNAGQVSFLTTHSEPLVEPTKVWRTDLGEIRFRRLLEYIITRWWRILFRLFNRAP